MQEGYSKSCSTQERQRQADQSQQEEQMPCLNPNPCPMIGMSVLSRQKSQAQRDYPRHLFVEKNMCKCRRYFATLGVQTSSSRCSGSLQLPKVYLPIPSRARPAHTFRKLQTNFRKMHTAAAEEEGSPQAREQSYQQFHAQRQPQEPVPLRVQENFSTWNKQRCCRREAVRK